MNRRKLLKGIASSGAVAFGVSTAAAASGVETQQVSELNVEDLDEDSYISTWEDGERVDHRVGDIEGEVEDVVGDPEADCCFAYCRSECPKLCLCCNWVADC